MPNNYRAKVTWVQHAHSCETQTIKQTCFLCVQANTVMNFSTCCTVILLTVTRILCHTSSIYNLLFQIFLLNKVKSLTRDWIDWINIFSNSSPQVFPQNWVEFCIWNHAKWNFDSPSSYFLESMQIIANCQRFLTNLIYCKIFWEYFPMNQSFTE